VGTGRGSAYNHYEYIGFGITMEDGLARLDEAEELMVAAWTGEDLKHRGEHWNVEFPQLRPRPYQQPHPPLVRACISEESTLRMAEIGRPVMIGIQTLPALQSRLERYQATMLDSGFTEAQVESAFDQCWASRDLFVAESYEEAYETAAAGFQRERHHFRHARELYNPGGLPPPDPNRPVPAGESFEHSFIVGTPSQVADQIAEMRDIGVRNLMLKLNTGEMDTNGVQKSMRLLGEKVLPSFG
jgi:alkanesulfonate monooxygenase SsuD/methylene tetrahydromethanopterin reductase-like flavin-dependent oxidoreductase (luciferase family)